MLKRSPYLVSKSSATSPPVWRAPFLPRHTGGQRSPRCTATATLVLKRLPVWCPEDLSGYARRKMSPSWLALAKNATPAKSRVPSSHAAANVSCPLRCPQIRPLVCPIPLSKGYRYGRTVVDWFSWWCKAFSIEDQDDHTASFIRLFIKKLAWRLWENCTRLGDKAQNISPIWSPFRDNPSRDSLPDTIPQLDLSLWLPRDHHHWPGPSVRNRRLWPFPGHIVCLCFAARVFASESFLRLFRSVCSSSMAKPQGMCLSTATLIRFTNVLLSLRAYPLRVQLSARCYSWFGVAIPPFLKFHLK